MQNNVFGMIFLLYIFFKTENTPSKNEVLYKIKFIVKKIRFEKKKSDFKIGCQTDTNLFVYLLVEKTLVFHVSLRFWCQII